jgi:hypothetical protein
MLAPVSGVVTAVNAELRKTARQVGENPYHDDWVMRIHAPDLRADLRTLLIGDDARRFLSDEVDSLYRMIEEVSGPLAADGGQITGDVFGTIPALGWQRLARAFLRSAA